MREYEPGKYSIVEGSLEKNTGLIVTGPFDTIIDAKRKLKTLRGLVEIPIIVKVVGTYQNYAMGNKMFSNKNGMALPDHKEMRIR